MHSIDRRLARLDLTLPVPPQPVGQYRATVRTGQLVFVSGQFPIRDGEIVYRGCVGRELSLAQGRDAARLAALNVLAQLRAVTSGWQDFAGIIRLEGYVSSAPGFYDQPHVLDAASGVFADVLGDQSGHVRTAISVSQLPLNAAVELVVIACLEDPMVTNV